MPVKSDRNNARGIAQLMRLGWFRPVHCKSIEAQETRAILTARKLLQSKLCDIQNSLRGVLRGFGLKVGATTERTFAERIRELVAGQWWHGRCSKPMPCCGASSKAWTSRSRSLLGRTRRPAC
jgi:transposase